MEGRTEASPPVNNLLQPDIYNRLDAEVIEKTRVANAQLTQRLRAQQRILAKYRAAQERFYRREKNVVQTELTRITTKLPAVSRIRHFRSKFLYGEVRAQGGPGSLGESVPDLRAHRAHRVPGEEKADLPFCERFFLHHLPNKKKYYRKARTPSPPPVAHRPTSTTAEGGTVLPAVPEALPGVTPIPRQSASGVRLLDPVAEHHRENYGSVGEGNGFAADNADVVQSSRVADGGARTRGDHSGGSEGRQSQSGQETERVTTLPPIHRQNLRLAHSSPQLFEG